jgi:predicted GTPase
MSCTGAVDSPASSVDEVIAEIAASRVTERGSSRADDRMSEADLALLIDAELAVILVDARHGFVEQTGRHAVVSALLRVPHVALAVNKMDLVGYAEDRFAEIAEEFTEYARKLGVPDVVAIPMSALCGDNVVEPSANMTWYAGPTLLEHLETVRRLIAGELATTTGSPRTPPRP